MNNGVLKNQYIKQHWFSRKWILDFFFFEPRLGIEIDGLYHKNKNQILKDKQKEIDCKEFKITLLRISNDEVFGDKQKLTQKLRKSWKEAINRK